MKSRGYSLVHEFGQDLYSAISELRGNAPEFKGVWMSEPGDSDHYVGFGNVYGLSSRVELGQVGRSFSMRQSMYCVDREGVPVEFEKGSLIRRGIRNAREEVPDLAEGFFFNFNCFCSENPCYVVNRFRGNLERFVGNRITRGKGLVPGFKNWHHYSAKDNRGDVHFELYKYEAVVSFLNDGSLFLIQDLCLPSEDHCVVERGSRKDLDLEIDEKGRLTDGGLDCLASRCFDNFVESCRSVSKQ